MDIYETRRKEWDQLNMEKKKIAVREKGGVLTGIQVGIKAPRGSEITCKSWQIEGAMRMLINNLDPEVAEKP